MVLPPSRAYHYSYAAASAFSRKFPKKKSRLPQSPSSSPPSFLRKENQLASPPRGRLVSITCLLWILCGSLFLIYLVTSLHVVGLPTDLDPSAVPEALQRPSETMATPRNSESNSNPDDPSNRQQHVQIEPDSSSMAACLLVMDDNHYLTEWLAYHYHVLPLRHVVLAVDPASKTSPTALLQRYQTLLPQLHVTEWQDTDYMTTMERLQAQEIVRDTFELGSSKKNHNDNDTDKANTGDHPDHDKDDKHLIEHRARQRLFYYKCMRHHKQNGRSWTLLTDTDEFLRVNYETVANLPGWSSSMTEPPPIEQPGSVLGLIATHQEGAYNNLTSTACIQIPRWRFGGTESDASLVRAMVPTGLDGHQFLTMRYRYHPPPEQYQIHRISKVLLDLSRVEWDDIQQVANIHRPIHRLCGHRKRYLRSYQQVLLLHHYLGSWEQYKYRDDARSPQDRLKMYQEAVNASNVLSDDAIRPWLQGFVEQHGSATASALFEGVGVLD